MPSSAASSDLDEYLIRDLKLQGAQISLWGVGTRLITAKDCPSFGGVYKLAAEDDGTGNMEPKIKLSDNAVKITNPGVKKILRIYDKQTGYLRGDLIALEDEVFDESQPLEIFDPENTWKRMRFKPGTYTLRELLAPIFRGGKLVYSRPSVMEIQQYCKAGAGDTAVRIQTLGQPPDDPGGSVPVSVRFKAEFDSKIQRGRINRF